MRLELLFVLSHFKFFGELVNGQHATYTATATGICPRGYQLFRKIFPPLSMDTMVCSFYEPPECVRTCYWANQGESGGGAFTSWWGIKGRGDCGAQPKPGSTFVNIDVWNNDNFYGITSWVEGGWAVYIAGINVTETHDQKYCCLSELSRVKAGTCSGGSALYGAHKMSGKIGADIFNRGTDVMELKPEWKNPIVRQFDDNFKDGTDYDYTVYICDTERDPQAGPTCANAANGYFSTFSSVEKAESVSGLLERKTTRARPDDLVAVGSTANAANRYFSTLPPMEKTESVIGLLERKTSMAQPDDLVSVGSTGIIQPTSFPVKTSGPFCEAITVCSSTYNNYYYTNQGPEFPIGTVMAHYCMRYAVIESSGHDIATRTCKADGSWSGFEGSISCCKIQETTRISTTTVQHTTGTVYCNVPSNCSAYDQFLNVDETKGNPIGTSMIHFCSSPATALPSGTEFNIHSCLENGSWSNFQYPKSCCSVDIITIIPPATTGLLKEFCDAPTVCLDNYNKFVNVNFSAPNSVGTVMVHYCSNSAEFPLSNFTVHLHTCLPDGTWNGFYGSSSCCLPMNQVATTEPSVTRRVVTVISCTVEVFCEAPNSCSTDHDQFINVDKTIGNLSEVGATLVHFCKHPATALPSKSSVNIHKCLADGNWSNFEYPNSCCSLDEETLVSPATAAPQTPFCVAPKVCLDEHNEFANVDFSAPNALGTVMVHYCEYPAAFSINNSKVNLYKCLADGTWSDFYGSLSCCKIEEEPTTVITTSLESSTVAYCVAPENCHDQHNEFLGIDTSHPNPVGTYMIHHCVYPATFLPTNEIVKIYSCSSDGTWGDFSGSSSCCNIRETTKGPTTSGRTDTEDFVTPLAETTTEPTFCPYPNISIQNIHPEANLTSASAQNPVGTMLLHFCNPPAKMMPETSEFVMIYVCQLDGTWSNLDGSTCEIPEVISTTKAPFCKPPDVSYTYIDSSANITNAAAENPLGTLLIHFCQKPAQFQSGVNPVRLHVCQSDGTWSNIDGSACELPAATTETPYCPPPNVSTANVHAAANVTKASEKNNIGTLLTHLCADGAVWRPIGDPVKFYVCQSDGTWSGLDGSACVIPEVELTTQEPYCPDPKISAIFVHESSNVTQAREKNPVGTLLIYYCQPPAAFRPPQNNPVKFLTCQSDGTWSNYDGYTCLPSEVVTTTAAPFCPTPNISTPYDHLYSNISKVAEKSPVGTLLVHLCQSPASLQPSGRFLQTYKCMADGSWNGLDGSVCTPPTITDAWTANSEKWTTVRPMFCGLPHICMDNIDSASNVTQATEQNAIGTFLVHICGENAQFLDDSPLVRVYGCNSDGTWSGIGNGISPCCLAEAKESTATTTPLSAVTSATTKVSVCPAPVICTDHMHSFSNVTKANLNENTIGTLLVHYCESPAVFVDQPNRSPITLYQCQEDGTWSSLRQPAQCCEIEKPSTTTKTTTTTTKPVYCDALEPCFDYLHKFSNLTSVSAGQIVTGSILLHYCQFPATLHNSNSPVRFYVCDANGVWRNFESAYPCCVQPGISTVTGLELVTKAATTLAHGVYCPRPLVTYENLDVLSNITMATDQNPVGTYLVHYCSYPAYFVNTVNPFKIYKCLQDGTWSNVDGSCIKD